MRYFANLLLLLSLTACGQAEQRTAATTTASSADSTLSPFIFGETRRLHSTVLQQDRSLNIYLPEGYALDTAARYPVIYVLDGSANEDFPHIAGIVQFMNMYDLMPKSIVVGIANVDRKHDFTHPSAVKSDLNEVPNSGGSAAFMSFIANEVQPLVDKHYRSDRIRTIIGQSLGGLFATEILFKQPDLFDQYIIVSPSLWWDNGSLLSQTSGFLATHVGIEKKVYISLGNEGDDMQANMDAFVKAFAEGSQPPLTWWYVPFKDETHATILHRSVYRAFELMHWKPRE